MQWLALCSSHWPPSFSRCICQRISIQPTGFQFEDNRAWIVPPPIRYHLGVDGLSMWLVVLTGFLAPIGVLVLARDRTERKSVLRPIPVAAGCDARHLCRAGHVPLLRILGALAGAHGDPDSHVRPDRGRRTRAAIKLLPLHLHSFGACCWSDPWLYAQTGTFDLPSWQRRSSHAVSSHRPGALARLARLPGCLCSQGSGLPAAWLAWRCHL